MDGAAVWTVDRQVEESQWQDGYYLPGVRVWFTTGSGQRGSVWIAAPDYSPARVRAAIDSYAGTMESVQQLQGG